MHHADSNVSVAVAVQSVEFWSTLCDIEMEMIEDGNPEEVRRLLHLQPHGHCTDLRMA